MDSQAKLKGVICGVFEGCERKEESNSFTLKEVILDRVARLQVPAVYGFPFGHISNQCTIPIGAKAGFDTRDFKLKITLP